MLYIASALTPTPVSHTVKADDFTSAGTTSLIIGKPDRVEVWDATDTGLVSRGELVTWGTVAGLATVSVPDARTHILVLVGPPNARLLLLGWEDGKLVVTASQALAPPMPALRRQEFFTGVISQGNMAFVSVWTGLLACVEMEVEKAAAAKRRASEAQTKGEGEEGRRLVLKSSFNINIREHNLLDIAFGPARPDEPPMVTFLWMSEYNKIQLQPRQFVPQKHQFDEHAPVTDVVNPLEYPVQQSEDVDFNDIPFSCPAGRNLLAIPGTGPAGARLFLVVGDEHAVLYSVTSAIGSPRKPSISSARASAVRRSPQSETGGVGKKRKSSMSGRSVNADTEARWHVQPVWRVRQGWGTVLAATVLETHASGGSVVLGDERGRLTAIGWEFDSGDAVRVGKVDLGIVSPPTALTYIDNGAMFVSSACGDSLLVNVSLPDTPPSVGGSTTLPRSIKGKGRAHESTDGGAWTIVLDDEIQGDLDVKERWMNIAPVKDLAVVEEDDGRVSHLVVASGSANTNSLRIVRSGVGLESVLTVEGVTGIERMWAITYPGDPHDGTPPGQPILVVSFANSTAVFNLEPEFKLAAIPEKFASQPTLAVDYVQGGLPGGALAQVTPAGVQLWNISDGKITAETEELMGFDAETEIVAGAIQNDVIVVAYRNGTVSVLENSGGALPEMAEGEFPSEPAAIAIDAHIDDTSYIAVADYSGKISLYDLMGLDEVDDPYVTWQERSFASSLMFQKDESGKLRLVAGLSDGTLVSYDVDLEGISSGLTKGRLVSSLGSRPLHLAPLELKSDRFEERVVAAGISDRLSVVFESRGHLEFSASGKKNVVAAAALATPSLGSCIALATPEGLTFERLTSLKKLQVLTLDTGDSSSTRLAHVPHQNLLAVGSITRTLDADTGDIFQASSLDLRHPTTLDFLGDYQLPEREAVSSVTAVFLNGRHYIALGTAIFSSDDAFDESNIDEVNSFVSVEKGRLLLIEAVETNGSWSFDVVETVETNGAVFDATVIHGFLAIASSTKASIMRFMDGSLQETAQFTFAFEAHYLDVLKQGGKDLLVLGDAMRSIIVLEIDEESGEIRSDQRDMAPHAVRSLGTARDAGAEDVIFTDEHANILTYRVESEGLTAAASFGLHEDMAQLRSGALVATHPDELRPDLLFATTNGRLGIIGELGLSATRTLQDLQRNMNKYLKGPGNLDWRAFRRGGSSLVPKETAGFIDGDFVQTFLDADANGDATKVLHGATEHERVSRLVGGTKEDASMEDVVRVLEAAGGLH